MSSRGAPRARGGGPGSRGGRGRGGRRPASADTDYEDAMPAAKRKKASKAIEPRELPQRDNRGLNPTRVDPTTVSASRAKRPNGALALDAAEKAKKAEELAAKREAALALLAEVTAEEQAAQMAEDESAIYSLEDLPLSDDAMVVDDENEPVLSTVEVDAPSKPAPTKTSKVKKPAKGTTRAEIDKQANKILAEKAKAVNKKGAQNSDAAAASKKAGLSADWVKKSKVTAELATDAPESSPLGGLTDEDAASSRPEVDKNAEAPRKNTMVALVSSDMDETPTRATNAAATVTVKTRGRPAKHTTQAAKIPALTLAPSSTPASIKTESSSGSFTPESGADVKGLPAFVAKTWSSIFLPACYLALYLSTDPMAAGQIGNDLKNPGKETVAMLQTVLDAKYQGHSYVVKWGDAICSKAVARIGEKRSSIGRAALKAVDQIFKDPKYFKDDNPSLRKSQVIINDVQYAIRSNGPAFWKVPTPEDVYKLESSHTDYIKPKGNLESPLIIETLSLFLKGLSFDVIPTADGKTDFSRLPIGALGMAAAAVERGYKRYANGLPEQPLDFSSANYGPAVAGFVSSIRRFQASRWESILKSCGNQINAQAAEPAEIQEESLDGRRELMYEPSSPAAASL